MKKTLILAIAACLLICTTAIAADAVRLSGGKTVSGEITGMTAQEVSVKSLGKTKPLAVNQIVSISFDDAPKTLNLARLAAGNGRYEDALKMLEKIKVADIRNGMAKQDVAFYKAMCAARLALAGNGEISAAGKQMNDFVRAYPQNYHWYEANELIGDLLVANKSFGRAAEYYDKLAKAPWPEYQIRAQVAIGEAKLAEGKTQEAHRAFESAMATNATGEAAITQKLYAKLGKARCLSEEGKTDEAVKLVHDIIINADAEEKLLMATAYNSLGTALRKAGKPNDALLAFLHVDVLYFAVSEEHAEALANLAELWNEVHRPQRAAEARQTLEKRYKNSRWIGL